MEYNLPEPQTDLDFPLMIAISLRRTKRKWKNEKITFTQAVGKLYD